MERAISLQSEESEAEKAEITALQDTIKENETLIESLKTQVTIHQSEHSSSLSHRE